MAYRDRALCVVAALVMLLAGCKSVTTSRIWGIGTVTVTVSGKVSSAVTGLPLEGAYISASALGLRAISGPAGVYSLSGETSGLVSHIDLTVEHVGYETRRVAVARSITTLDIELTPQPR